MRPATACACMHAAWTLMWKGCAWKENGAPKFEVCKSKRKFGEWQTPVDEEIGNLPFERAHSLKQHNKLCHVISNIMDYFFAGELEDQQQTDQPNDQAGVWPLLQVQLQVVTYRDKREGHKLYLINPQESNQLYFFLHVPIVFYEQACSRTSWLKAFSCNPYQPSASKYSAGSQVDNSVSFAALHLQIPMR